TCPACSTALTKPGDAVISVLNPRDDHITSVLSGLSPSATTEICTRGIAFWTYRVSHEVYASCNILTSTGAEIRGEKENIVRDISAEVSALHNKIAGMELVEDELGRKAREQVQGRRRKARKLAQ
ncbi:unnamed protein product, partial [Tuber aestivum]